MSKAAIGAEGGDLEGPIVVECGGWSKNAFSLSMKPLGVSASGVPPPLEEPVMALVGGGVDLLGDVIIALVPSVKLLLFVVGRALSSLTLASVDGGGVRLLMVSA